MSSSNQSAVLPSAADYHAGGESTSWRRRDPEHILRPRIFFRSHFIEHLMPSNSGARQQHEISKRAGEAWRRLSKKLHKARYPDYVYASGRATTRRGSSIHVASWSNSPTLFPSPNIDDSSSSFHLLSNLEAGRPPFSDYFTESKLCIPERDGFSANFIPDDNLTSVPTTVSSGSEPWLHDFNSYGYEGTGGLPAPSDEIMYQFLTEGMSPSTGTSPFYAVSNSFASVVEGNYENQEFSFDIDHLDFSDLYASPN
ncbi:hypothetical protein CPC08DRAFT_822829 [Agrocybe pediades]|nr:hypothetical protein CPC08DRAFT_822829 [Agrocybe pediades]